MRKLVFILFVVAFFIFSLQPNSTSAQTENIAPEAFSELNDFTTMIASPPGIKNPEDPKSIDETTEQILVTFPGISFSDDVRVCLREDFCINDYEIRSTIALATPDKLDKLIQDGIPSDRINTGRFENNGNTEGDSVRVCADGEQNLKTDCKDERDYFHAGKTYFVTVYEKQDDSWVVRRKAGLYINHHMPIVTVVPLNNKAPEKFRVELSQDKLSKDGKEKNNNFQIVAQGTGGYKQERCIPRHAGDGTFKSDSLNSPYVVEFPYRDADHPNADTLVAGKYVFKISEQVNDNRIVGSGGCEGGFTYLRIECTVPSANSSNPNVSTTCKTIEDPNGSDARNLQKLLDQIGKESSSIIPCEEGKPNPGLLECESLDTSIGPIPLNPVGFITRLFQIALAFAGVGAMLLILYAGYRLLLSRGDKEVIQAQRDRITSAIVGLLFIIFSLVLLSVIAGDVLKLPGFNDNPLPGQTNTR